MNYKKKIMSVLMSGLSIFFFLSPSHKLDRYMNAKTPPENDLSTV